jgi:hypothetical protein
MDKAEVSDSIPEAQRRPALGRIPSHIYMSGHRSQQLTTFVGVVSVVHRNKLRCMLAGREK